MKYKPDLRGVRKIIAIPFFIFLPLSCLEKDKEESSDTSASEIIAQRYLYVSSGACYSGPGNTTFSNITASNLVFRIDLENKSREVIADYNSSPAQSGDTPVGIGFRNPQELYVLIDNTTAGARRIERVAIEAQGARSLFSNNTTALSITLRGLHMAANGDLLINKNNAVERINSSNVRLIKGANNPYVNNPAAPCAISTTLISKVTTLSNQFIAFSHAATSQNRIGFVRPEGYGMAGDCTVAQAAPVAGAFPAAMAYDAANSKLLVAYAGNTLSEDINSIYAYDIDQTANSVAVTGVHKIYDSSQYPTVYPYILYGISEMTLDPQENALYIASAVSSATTIQNYAIEKFSYSPALLGVSNSQVLARIGSEPFYRYGSDTKCISTMLIGN